MASNGIAPLSTTMALAFTSGSSTTSQRPTPKKITAARTKPAPPMAERMGHLRERGRETKAGLSEFAIWEPAHAIPPCRAGQSASPDRRFTIGGAHDLRPAPYPFPDRHKRRQRPWSITPGLEGQDWSGGGPRGESY